MSTIDELEAEQAALGKRLQIARRRRRLSQRELASRMGVNRLVVLEMERVGPAKFMTLLLAFRALGLPLDAVRQLADPAEDQVGLSEEIRRQRRSRVTSARERLEFGD